jgi:hypothetical protein
MSATRNPSAVHAGSVRQRRATHDPGAAPLIVHQVLQSPGQPLDAPTQRFMEARFGHDFSNVRLHTDAAAAQSARAVNALAYTVGSHIVFGANQYDRTANAGQATLAHELTHVVQQVSGVIPPGIQMKPDNTKKPAATPQTVSFKIKVDRDTTMETVRREFVKQYYSCTTAAQVEAKLPLWTFNRSLTDADFKRGFVVVTTFEVPLQSGSVELDEKEKEAVNKETDQRFWESTGHKPGQKLGTPAQDREMAAVWKGIRRAVLTEGAQRKEIDALPDDIKKVLFAGGSNATAVAPDDYSQVLQIAHKLAALSPEERQDYLSRVNAATTSFSDLNQSIDTYLRFRAEREQQAQEHEEAAQPLLGAEDLYTQYKNYLNIKRNASLAHSGMSTGPKDPTAAQESVDFLDEQVKQTETALLAALNHKGFDSIEAFEAALEAYRVAFRTQAVNLALDVLARYEHKLFEEREKLRQPGAAAAIVQGIAGTQAAAQFQEARSNERMANVAQLGVDPQDKMNRARDQAQAQKYREQGAAARAQAESEVIRGSDNDFLVGERGTDREKLAGLDAAGAQAYLLETLNKRAEDLRASRQEFQHDPDRVFALPDLISAAKQLQGIDDTTIYGKVIDDYIHNERLKHLLSGLALGVLALALALLVPGGGWLAAAALVANAGISTYQAYVAYHEYEEQSRDYRLHFLQEEPSLLWVGVAVAAAALDLGMATSAVWKESAAALKALQGPLEEFSKGGDLGKLVKEIEAAEGLKAQVKAALEREAQSAKAAEEAMKELGGKAYGLLPGMVDPGAAKQVFRALYYSVKRGINTIAKLRADAKLVEALGNITRMSGAERAELEAAFEEVKQLVQTGQAKSMDEGSLLGYVDRWAINRGKPGFQGKLFEEMKSWKPLTAEQERALSALGARKAAVAELYEEKDALLREREELLPKQKDPATRTEEARKRLAEINQRLGELDPSFSPATRKAKLPVKVDGEVVDRLVDVPVKHPPGKIQEAEGLLTAAEKEAEKSQLTLYDRLRAAAPSDAAKERALKGVTTDQIGPLKTKPTALQAEHIISIREIADMDGVSELPWKDLKGIADMKENLVAMDGAANASKGDRTWRSWNQASNFYSPSTIDAMAQREAQVRALIQDEIKRRLSAVATTVKP